MFARPKERSLGLEILHILQNEQIFTNCEEKVINVLIPSIKLIIISNIFDNFNDNQE